MFREVLPKGTYTPERTVPLLASMSSPASLHSDECLPDLCLLAFGPLRQFTLMTVTVQVSSFKLCVMIAYAAVSVTFSEFSKISGSQ